MAFRKAPTSLVMSREQQTLTRAAHELCNPPGSIMELKRITAKLFGNQRQEIEEVRHAQENSDAEEEEAETEWEMQTAKSSLSKKRGWKLDKSIKSTQSLYGMKGS